MLPDANHIIPIPFHSKDSIHSKDSMIAFTNAIATYVSFSLPFITAIPETIVSDTCMAPAGWKQI